MCDYHVFREGIKPMWEDDANRDGGKWIVAREEGRRRAVLGGRDPRNRRRAVQRGRRDLRAVLSVRYNEDIISLWNKSAESRKLCMQIRETLRTVMGLPADAVMEYKKHVESMRDNSSYRNTNAFDEKEGGGGGGGGGGREGGGERREGGRRHDGEGRRERGEGRRERGERRDRTQSSGAVGGDAAPAAAAAMPPAPAAATPPPPTPRRRDRRRRRCGGGE